MDLGLKGRTVIITGGASNIGRGIVRVFAEEGAKVVIAEIDEGLAQQAAEEAKKLGATDAIAVKTDVHDYASVEAMVKKTLERFGKVDTLVNNVGGPKEGLFLEKSREDWMWEITHNYIGMLNCIRAVLPHMVEKKYGKIVSIASDSGKMGEYRESIYAGAKGAVIASTKSIAREVGRYGINVNVICPAVIIPKKDELGTGSAWRGAAIEQYSKPEVQEQIAKLYPLRRLGKPEDIGNMAAFLCSDRGSWITGQAISVDGGFLMA